MDNKENKTLLTTGKQVAGAVAGATVGVLMGGVPGAIAGAALGEVAREVLLRQLSEGEKSRIQKVTDLATQKILSNIENGSIVRADLNEASLHEMYEGLLLKARDAYEVKKLEIYANICAATPFTNTPIQSMHQSLLFAEQLSYQQLCVIALVGEYRYMPEQYDLSKVSLSNDESKLNNENYETVYNDVVTLAHIGLLRMAGTEFINDARRVKPADLFLTSTGELLCNSMQGKGSIAAEDFEHIKEVLS